MSVAGLSIIALNIIISYMGWKDDQFMGKYQFQVAAIISGKQYYRLISSGFLHADARHLLFNMLSLFLFSAGVETHIGILCFLGIYFGSLVGGNLLALYLNRHDAEYTAIGASGAVSGIVFSAIMINPNMGIGSFFLPIYIPAWVYGLMYMIYSIYSIRKKGDNIGHEAHLGGAICGLLLTLAQSPALLLSNYLYLLLMIVPSIALLFYFHFKPANTLGSLGEITKNKYRSIDHKYNEEKLWEQKAVDSILDKISKKGYKSLTEKEKQYLKEHSSKK